MKRSQFLRNSLVATGTALGIGAFENTFATSPKKEKAKTNQPFNLNYAPHKGLFKNHAGDNFIDEIKYYHELGFRAIEDNGYLKRSVKEQEEIGNTLAKLGMTMGVFVVDGGDNWKTSLTTGKKEFLDKFVETCQKSVEAAKRCNAKWLTVVPGFYERKLPYGNQFANVVEAMRRGAEVFEPHGLIMVLETLSDTPELFLQQTHETYAVCKAVNSPSCKILYDIYHMQRTEGNLIVNIDRCWDEIAYIQIGDNPGRKEPTTGEINYKNLFKHIYNKGYKGVMGMEHGKSVGGKEGEIKLVDAYREVDSFL
ncbi:Xylose isomerase domain-containing protein TIM barrel [Pseudopedobacter saltans DSM 12145]|uniref:Xylose isomerase domain-containing protein TIM barrel n=1 Tax=Pseudopedobacter saltans (strain ATCC 51119 / DSM 12145 / JCM 21818 / CCUG 39354 / LMG 10337 / NBRC 100064 / NCIMB 13643) TaxID=762903 RepID=F0S4L3_PSESL|nr:TIM barrel protein [Pseudopedobacter saltans]ADY52004.1 Xylose isomerase domain-containing protein TIM barrel [Pseudopedobacter saltans DSM 12145]